MERTQQQLEHHQHVGGKQRYAVSLLLHDLDEPLNVGGLFRLADALGLEQVFLSGTTPQPPERKIRKTSRSAEKYVNYAYYSDLDAALHAIAQAEYQLLGLEITANSTPLPQFAAQPQDRLCLVLGNERTGMAETLLDACPQLVHIPMQGNNSSMNVTTACGIAAYVITQMLQAQPVDSGGI